VLAYERLNCDGAGHNVHKFSNAQDDFSIIEMEEINMMKRLFFIISILLVATSLSFAQADKSLLMQKPALSKTQIVFAYAGDLWIVGREGGEAQRFTTGEGIETDPVFSPDGLMVAFTGEYDGNTDVYVVPATGGVPRRLTYHPGVDAVVGWTPDGKQILFRSFRNSPTGMPRLLPDRSPLADGRSGFVFARWSASGLCADYSMAGSLETVQRRTDDADLDSESGGFEYRKVATRKLQRQKSDVGGQQNLFSL
jgi:Tol biopolymer transport system component